MNPSQWGERKKTPRKSQFEIFMKQYFVIVNIFIVKKIKHEVAYSMDATTPSSGWHCKYFW